MSTPEERPSAPEDRADGSAGRSPAPDDAVESEGHLQPGTLKPGTLKPGTRKPETRTPARTASARNDSIGAVNFMTVAEVAASMRVSKMTVYRMVHNGEIAAVRVGRSFRVPAQAVHDYLENAFIETG